MPDSLIGRTFRLDGDVAADVAEAEAALARLDAMATSLSNTEPLAHILLRAEAVASSRIEGLEVGPRRLLRAQATGDLDAEHRDVTAQEVLANIEAMTWAFDAVGKNDRIGPEHVLETHRLLLARTHLAPHAGRLRTEQNWIGGSAYNPCAAAFVPPPPEDVPALFQDLLAFCNEDGLPAVAQAAIAHAQFETTHPFVDGNGRTGRALIHLILRRRGLAQRVLPPVSLILATWSRDYIERLRGTHYLGPPDSPEASDGDNRWIAMFAAACTRAVSDATQFEHRIATLRQDWRTRLGRVRANSATDLLVDALPGAPVLTVIAAASLIHRGFNAANEAIERLTEAGILTPITLAKRNRAFEAAEVIDAFAELERQLSSPEGDTRASPPERRVPARKRRA